MKRSRCPVCGAVIPAKDLFFHRNRLASTNYTPIRNIYCSQCGADINIRGYYTNPIRILATVFAVGTVLYLYHHQINPTHGDGLLAILFACFVYASSYFFDEYTPM